MAISQTHSLDLEFGSTQYATITDAAQTGLQFTTAMTLEGWFNFESFPTSLAGLIGKLGGASNRAYGFFFDTGSPTSLRLNLSGNGTAIEQEFVNWSPSLATWYHIAVTYDGSAGEVKFYVNGSQQGTTQTTSVSSIFDNTSGFEIGGIGASGVFTFDGKIDDVRAWNIVRTEAQINDNKDNCDLDPATSGLVSWWALDNDYTDECSAGNDLTAANSPVFVTDLPYTCSVGGANTTNFFYMN